MNNPQHAGLRGGVLGLTAYGTYALTGQSLFAGWGWSLTFVDCAWGMVLSAVVAYLTTRFFGKQSNETRGELVTGGAAFIPSPVLAMG